MFRNDAPPRETNRLDNLSIDQVVSTLDNTLPYCWRDRRQTHRWSSSSNPTNHTLYYIPVWNRRHVSSSDVLLEPRNVLLLLLAFLFENVSICTDDQNSTDNDDKDLEEIEHQSRKKEEFTLDLISLAIEETEQSNTQFGFSMGSHSYA